MGSYTFSIYIMPKQENDSFLDQTIPQNDFNAVNRDPRNKNRQWSDKQRDRRTRNQGRPVDENQTRSSKYATHNLSTGLLSRKFFNEKVVTDTFRSIQDNVLVKRFFIKPSKQRLELQADVWAQKHVSMQDLYLKDILSNSRSFEWHRILKETYIYSYFKSVLYAFKDINVSEVPGDSYLVTGHALLYNMLVRTSFSFNSNEINIRYVIGCDDDQLKFIMDMCKEYSYLKDYIIDDSRFSFEHYKYDRVLEKLNANRVPNGPEVSKMLDVNRFNTMMSQDNFPLCNSYYRLKDNGKDPEYQFYYAYSEKFNLLGGTTLFGKAVFLYTQDNEYNRYYDLNTRNDEYYLVKYEVTSLAGSNYPNPTLEK